MFYICRMDEKKKELARLIVERPDFLAAFAEMLGVATTYHLKVAAYDARKEREGKESSYFRESNYLWAAKWVREDAERTLKQLDA